MQRRTLAILCALGALFSGLLVATPVEAAARTVNVAYGPSGSQRMTVFMPGGTALRPAVLFVHGGCWRRGNMRPRELAAAREIARRTGWVVAAMNYRAGHNMHKTQPADVRSALWKLQTGGFGVDPRRVALWGESAGAHLSLLTGYRGQGKPGFGRPAAVVSVRGPTDMFHAYATPGVVQRCVRQFEGGTPANRSLRYVQTSPTYHVDSTDPATVLIMSMGDQLVPATHATQLSTLLQANRVRHQVVVVPSTRHSGSMERRGTVAGPRAMVTAIRFLNAQFRRR